MRKDPLPVLPSTPSSPRLHKTMGLHRSIYQGSPCLILVGSLKKEAKEGRVAQAYVNPPSPCPSGLVWSSAVEPWHQRRPPAPSHQNPSGCGPSRPQPSLSLHCRKILSVDTAQYFSPSGSATSWVLPLLGKGSVSFSDPASKKKR